MAGKFSLQRVDRQYRLAFDGKRPLGQQLVAADLAPSLHQTGLAARQAAVEQFAGLDAEHGFVAGVQGMDVRLVVCRVSSQYG